MFLFLWDISFCVYELIFATLIDRHIIKKVTLIKPLPRILVEKIKTKWKESNRLVVRNGNLLIFMNCILVRAFVGGYTDGKNMKSMHNMQWAGIFYFHVTVHRNKFLYNKTNQMHQFPKFTPTWNSIRFGQWNCPKLAQFHAGVNLGNWCIWLVLL